MALWAVLACVHTLGALGVPLTVERLAASPPRITLWAFVSGHEA